MPLSRSTSRASASRRRSSLDRSSSGSAASATPSLRSCALRPIVESGFQPFAYSPEHASGVWQFIPSTARRWGLELAARGNKNAKKRAVVAVARRLAVLLHRLWITGEVYEPLRHATKAIAA